MQNKDYTFKDVISELCVQDTNCDSDAEYINQTISNMTLTPIMMIEILAHISRLPLTGCDIIDGFDFKALTPYEKYEFVQLYIGFKNNYKESTPTKENWELAKAFISGVKTPKTEFEHLLTSVVKHIDALPTESPIHHVYEESRKEYLKYLPPFHDEKEFNKPYYRKIILIEHLIRHKVKLYCFSRIAYKFSRLMRFPGTES